MNKNPEPKPSLLMLHGAVVNGRMWDAVRAQLADDYHIATPDLPGHGADAQRPYSLAAATTVAVQAAVDELPPGPLVLVGDSLGAYTAMAAAPLFARRLAGVVLGGCSADFRGLTAAIYRLRGALFLRLPPERLQALLERKIAREFPWSTAMLKRGLRAAAFAEAVAALRGFDVPAALGRIEAPVLLVNGSRDWFNRLGETWALRDNPQVEYRRLAGIGHGVSIRAPAAFAGLLETFVARQAAIEPTALAGAAA